MAEPVQTASTVVQSTAGLRWSDIVALVGAAAWLPQLWRFLQKPKVTPIVGGQIELGFTSLGPVFNPKIAFRVERRVALVIGIDFKVVHERGQVTNFKCTQLVEYGSQSESTSGEKAVHQRQQDVVAIVLNPVAIVERKVNSREANCLHRLEELNIDLARAIDRMRSDAADWIDQLQRSREYADISKFLEDSFLWRAGKYSVECFVTVAGQSQPSRCSFQFILGDKSVALLKDNIQIIEEKFRTSLLPPPPPVQVVYSSSPLPPKPREFNWIYANVQVNKDSSN